MDLTYLEKGDEAEILHIVENEYTTKLMTFGLKAGSKLTHLGFSPFKDAVCIQINQHQVALRIAEAKSIIIGRKNGEK